MVMTTRNKENVNWSWLFLMVGSMGCTGRHGAGEAAEIPRLDFQATGRESNMRPGLNF